MSKKKWSIRQNREYKLYKEGFRSYKKFLKKKGLEFYDPIMFKKSEYFSKKAQAIKDYREEHGIGDNVKITIPNYRRDLIYSQAYYRELKEVRKAKSSIKENILKIKKEILLGEEEVVAKNGKVKTVELTEKDIAQKEQELQWLKEANKFRVSDIRTGKQEFLDLLSKVNDGLKDRGLDNSYDRRKWIKKEFFGYAS